MKFNEDGSLKLPEGVVKRKDDNEQIFLSEPAIKVVRDMVSMETPLKCVLRLECNDKVPDFERVDELFTAATGKFRHMSDLRISKVDDKNFDVAIVSGQYRCSWCDDFLNFIKSEMGLKMIDETSCMSYTNSKLMK